MENMGSLKVIDVSKHNGIIDFDKVKAAGIDGVIIRAGYGKVLKQQDPLFIQNYEGAKKAGLHVGAYWYSYAINEEEARQEAAVFLQVIKGKQFDLPVYYDIEEETQAAKGITLVDKIANTFCDIMQSNGYFVGLYTSTAWAYSYYSAATRKKFSLWVADWRGQNGYKETCDAWQYTCKGKVNGINGDVDMSVFYKYFPATIKEGGFNGYPRNSSDINNGDTADSKQIELTVDGITYRGEVFRV